MRRRHHPFLRLAGLLASVVGPFACGSAGSARGPDSISGGDAVADANGSNGGGNSSSGAPGSSGDNPSGSTAGGSGSIGGTGIDAGGPAFDSSVATGGHDGGSTSDGTMGAEGGSGTSAKGDAASPIPLATGDSRSVTQPSYPAVCTTLSAQFTSAQRSSPPAADDTGRLASALARCAGTGQSIVLAASGSNDSFYTGGLGLNGEGLVIDSGVTLYGNDSYAGQANLIDIVGADSSLMGPGTVDGRGDLLRGTARLVQASNTKNLIVYDVTLAQALHPNLYVEGGSGFTAWGVSIRTPATRGNADGIDIDSLTDATVIHSSVEAGDDGIAIKTNAGNVSNVTVEDTKVYGTHGLSIGGIDKNTVSNILFTNDYVYGNDLSGTGSTDSNAINIKTGPCSLTVTRVTYTNTCITQVKHLIGMNTNYNVCTTGGSPQLSDIVVNGVYSTASLPGAFTKIFGPSAALPIKAYLAHVNLDVTTQNGDQFASVWLDGSNDVPSGTGVTTASFSMIGSVPTCSF